MLCYGRRDSKRIYNLHKQLVSNLALVFIVSGENTS